MGLEYRAPVSPWRVQDGEIHLCLVPLSACAAGLARLHASLAPDERIRADRFRTPALRESFVIARGALRAILGGCLGLPAAAIRFEYGDSGKPRLAGAPLLRFNLSHSGGHALYALALGRELGVDLEHAQPLPDCEQIAQRFFSAGEIHDLASLPAAARNAAFFTCWTRKEAYIKARGEGLGVPLDEFRVSLLPAEPPRLDTPLDPRLWTLFDASPGPGYAAALAVQGAAGPLKAWRFADGDDCTRYFG